MATPLPTLRDLSQKLNRLPTHDPFPDHLLGDFIDDFRLFKDEIFSSRPTPYRGSKRLVFPHQDPQDVGRRGGVYLGMGPQPPNPEWGAMLQESRIYFLRAPWLMIAPGLALTLTVLGFNLLAEGLRDALDLRRIDGL
jgi:hypothetical protein